MAVAAKSSVAVTAAGSAERGAAAIERWCERNLRWVFPAPAVAAMVLLMVFPLLYTAYLSLHQWYASSVLGPEFVGFKNYVELMTRDERFWPAVARTLAFTLGSVALALSLGLGTAHLLVRHFPGRGLARTLYLLPMIATPVAMALVWMTMMSPTIGVLNYFLRSLGLPASAWVASPMTVIPALLIVETWMWTPMIGLICLAGLSSLPAEPFESALVDGASGWQVFWHVTLPLMRSTLVVAALFRTIDALKVFDIIYVMTEGGPGFASETLNLYVFQTSFKYLNLGYASALIVIFFTLILGASLLLLRVRKVRW
jgi:multiple sugar transport system permease protein